MDCTRVDEELIAFQLAALDGATRAAVEAHLTGCSRCVSAFLALKRAIDAGEDAVAPSEMVRARIRQAAQKQLTADSSQPTATEQKQQQKRGARAAVWVMAATAAAVLVAAPFAWRLSRSGQAPATSAAQGTDAEPQAPVEKTVDTARATPDSLAFL